MFYCNRCAEDKGWPQSLTKSTGICEVCELTASCNNVPSSSIPKPAEAPTPVCITPGCGKTNQRQGLWKGLCSSCYGQAKKLIDAGETTWDELAAMGMVKLEEKPFTALFKQKKQNVRTQADVERDIARLADENG